MNVINFSVFLIHIFTQTLIQNFLFYVCSANYMHSIYQRCIILVNIILIQNTIITVVFGGE